MEVPVLDKDMADSFHEKLKKRVADLWKEKHNSVKTYEFDLLLQAIQCYAEDLLYIETGLEIE